jgi:hypothetical protein
MLRALHSNGCYLQSRRLATGTCLPSRCPETTLVYPPISRLLHSNTLQYFQSKIYSEKYTYICSAPYVKTQNLPRDIYLYEYNISKDFFKSNHEWSFGYIYVLFWKGSKAYVTTFTFQYKDPVDVFVDNCS